LLMCEKSHLMCSRLVLSMLHCLSAVSLLLSLLLSFSCSLLSLSFSVSFYFYFCTFCSCLFLLSSLSPTGKTLSVSASMLNIGSLLVCGLYFLLLLACTCWNTFWTYLLLSHLNIPSCLECTTTHQPSDGG